MHDWAVKCTKAVASSSIAFDGNKLKEIKSFQVKIPVKDLKSEKESGKMDNKMHETLKMKTNPDITFNLTRISAYPSESNGNMLNAVGTLTIGGVSREENLNVAVKILEDNSLSFKGSKKIKMTDFKLKPPTAMMGMMKTGDEIEIQFDCSMKKN
jgi:polyisoprenoid-binding protein YceI